MLYSVIINSVLFNLFFCVCVLDVLKLSFCIADTGFSHEQAEEQSEQTTSLAYCYNMAASAAGAFSTVVSVRTKITQRKHCIL